MDSLLTTCQNSVASVDSIRNHMRSASAVCRSFLEQQHHLPTAHLRVPALGHAAVWHLTLNRPIQCRRSNDNLKRICLLNATDSHNQLTCFCQLALVTVLCLRRSISRLLCIVLYSIVMWHGTGWVQRQSQSMWIYWTYSKLILSRWSLSQWYRTILVYP